MGFELLTGGIRSGKSSLAVRIASAWDRPVMFVATGEPGDEEMVARIERHRAERPAEWTTVEAPRDLQSALDELPRDAGVVVDCLTLWVANLLEQEDDEVILARARAAARRCAAAPEGVVITNEVGWGIVPMHPVSRRYGDLLGRVNATFAEAATRTRLVVAGRTVDLSAP